MNDEEMQQKMEFIINQQAQFAVDIQQLRESQSKLTDAVIGVVGVVGKLAEQVEEIAEAQKRTDEKFIELAESQKRTDAKLAETDERLNIFINAVERYISERRNGPQPKQDPNTASDS